ncbi:polysaccharide deacetylase family protein [Nonomuraea sp. LPB2021202275-12-8]|uniref:polysaccharide deacetylase family protein n=1 Tax=Nonomuraea sp. LPB2021202275-12-8 TaxID=3120159 RepID=UPI00300C0D3E
MRVWMVPPVLLALAGCGAGTFSYVQSAPPRPFPDPETLAKRLVAMQPDWPEPRVDCRQTGCVALTFDDGPGRYTGKLLDMLRRRDVKATFFVVGEMAAAERGPEHLRQMVRDGHQLGNHSWSHKQLTTLPKRAIRRQLRRTDDLVRQETGVRMRVMRPPYGSTDRRVAALTRRRGQAQILWNVDTFDWRDRVPAVVARRGARAGRGAVVLMHDIHRTTVKAVPELIDRLTRKGYAFATVTELYGRRPEPGRRYEDDLLGEDGR